MKKHRKKIGGLVLVILIIVAIGTYVFLSDKNRLTPVEREWLTQSASTVININVVNDENYFGNNGKGMFFDFLNDFQKKYKLSFNTITYKNGEKALGATFGSSNTLPTDALSFYTDHYVYVGKKEEVLLNLDSLKNKKIGVVSANASYLETYLKDLELTSYNSKEELLEDFEKNEIEGIIVPRIQFIDVILGKNYIINYHLSDIPYYYYMNDVENSRLKSTMTKFYNNWLKNKFDDYFYTEERNLFVKQLKIEDKDLAQLQGKTVTYGLVNNSPYEVLSSGNVGGIMTEYIKAFKAFSDIDIEFKRYNNPKKFMKNITDNEVTLYMDYFTQNSNGASIATNIGLEFSIFVNKHNPLVVDSLNSLNGKTIYVEENTILATYLSKNANLKVKTYSREKEWNKIRKEKDAIIAIDSTLGEYYKKHDLKKFREEYRGVTNERYSLKSMNNDVFNNLLTKYVNYLDNQTLYNKGLYQNELTEQKGGIISKAAEYAFYLIVFVSLIIALTVYNSKKVRLAKKIKKDDKLKYIDQLTSLKNRNYLNENISSWNKNTVYPQSVIMLDLNKLQEINDTLGYEEGDKQIQAVANILIRSQLDNTDMIRTDGNEFMIYLVGYTQKQVTSYIHKINKEFKKLPYDYGVSISYSMIVDDLKDISDAINECVEDIKKQKEEKKEEKE